MTKPTKQTRRPLTANQLAAVTGGGLASIPLGSRTGVKELFEELALLVEFPSTAVS